MSDEQQRYELQLMFEHPAFEKLLQRAMKDVGHMRNEDLAYSLLGMVKLGVPESSRVVQTFLRNCQVGYRPAGKVLFVTVCCFFIFV